ncbi:hypothetical protein HW555_009634, partial [Spodoptera exigua]
MCKCLDEGCEPDISSFKTDVGSGIIDMDKKLLSNTPEDDDAQLNTFKKRRAGHKGKVTIFKNYIESLNSKKKIALTELEILQLKNRLEVYKTLEHDFDVNQTLIEDIVGVSDEQLKEREQFDSEYQNQLALAMQLMRDSESTGITDGSVQTPNAGGTKAFIKLPTIDLPHFSDRADLLQTLEEKHKQNHVDIKSNKPAQNQTSTSRSPSCPLCKAQHYLFSCPDFKQMTVEKRIEKVSKMNVCSNCLYPGHEKKTCRGGTCKYCSLKHNTLLHIEKPKSSSITCTSTQQTSVLLSTTLVDVLGSDDQLSRFWELDSLSDSQNTDPCDADACEVIFKQTTTRKVT